MGENDIFLRRNKVTNGTVSVYQCIASLDIKSGGTSRVVVQLADALANFDGFKVELLYGSNANDTPVKSDNAAVLRRDCKANTWFSQRLGLPLCRVLSNCAPYSHGAVVHNHGLWLPTNFWAAWVARRHRLPLLMQPHGMLEPWALHHRAVKKKIALALFQRRHLESANVIVATSAEECRNIRALGLRQPIALIPNGIELDGVCKSDEPTMSMKALRTVLFLSRIHKVKGLINLVRAWAMVRPVGWRLCIAGPDEGGHLAEVMAAVRANGIANVVDYVGEVSCERKAVVYQEADLFVLPSFSENFGVVVAEALAHGLPVITTKGAPWAELEEYRCGWWIDIGVEPLVNALRRATSLSDAERQQMGARGRVYAQRYNWSDIAKELVDVYRWVLKQGERPDCVHLD